ncbi:YceI family protein [Roseateles toxinivorans]|uniref:Polyisoprenoid-binding protein YceI n=1 Tax=Roseateles toxinivorans TaxID=270368 RepID=A0A4R6QJG2_9BURK|nr:YceI family protein [Roseateles toxinivorans]TDP62501.1 polyisoprenoid-binding protein YceI [Roseateles toxinivorans]
MTSLNSKLLFGSTLLLALAGAAWAQAKPAVLVPAQSDVSFTSKQMGVPVDGKFKRFDAQIAFDPKKPETGKVAFTIDIASATLGAPEFDAELAKAAWFDAKKIPQASFQSSAIKASGPGKFDVTGKLSIKGQTRDITVPVTIAQAGAVSTATGAFAIKRLEFKIGEGEWSDTSMVANDVQVKFKLTLNGLAPL